MSTTETDVTGRVGAEKGVWWRGEYLPYILGMRLHYCRSNKCLKISMEEEEEARKHANQVR